MHVPVKGAGTPKTATFFPWKSVVMDTALSTARLEDWSSMCHGRAFWRVVVDEEDVRLVPMVMVRAMDSLLAAWDRFRMEDFVRSILYVILLDYGCKIEK